MAVSFVVGGVLGVPGCEMRAIPYAFARRSGAKPRLQH